MPTAATPDDRRWPGARSTDVDEHARRLVGWHQEYSQLSAGRFDGRVLQADLGAASLVVEHTNQRLRQRFVVPRGEVVVAVQLEPSGDAFWGDTRLDVDAVAVCAGGEPTELLTPRDFGIVGVAVPLDGVAADALRPGAPRLLRDRGAAATLRQAVAHCVEATRTAADPASVHARLAPGLVLRATELAARAAGHEPAPPEPGLARRLSLVRRAEAFVEADAERAPTVSDLCRATGACRRTLQASFVDVLGIGPSRYLRALRLNRARAELRRGEASVSEVAARWGFVHFGRFAADYRALFGEAPSATRGRASGRDAADFG
jgi:AraC family ethanolamine operon transcriptional activator